MPPHVMFRPLPKLQAYVMKKAFLHLFGGNYYIVS